MRFSDHPDFDLAKALNAAANGRVFCILLAAINLGNADLRMALLSALPIGFAVFADRLNHGFLSGCAAGASFAIAALTAIQTLLNVW